MALKTREGIFFSLKKSNEAENFSGFNEETEQERRCDIMKHKILAALEFVGFVVSHKSWICYCTQICNLPTLDPSATGEYFPCLVPFKLRPQNSTIFSEWVFPLLTVNTVECHIHTAGVLYLLLIAAMI